jgi:hypothetical protein
MGALMVDLHGGSPLRKGVADDTRPAMKRA